jgi:MSHA biogenesis protein MshP
MKSQRGFALVSAIFLIVIVAALSAFAFRIGTGQQGAVDLRLLGDRAQAAAESGIEWAAYWILTDVAHACPTSPSTFVVNGYNVQVSCTSQSHSEGLPPVPTFMVYDVTAKAWSQNASYGSPEYVFRKVSRTFER